MIAGGPDEGGSVTTLAAIAHGLERIGRSTESG